MDLDRRRFGRLGREVVNMVAIRSVGMGCRGNGSGHWR